MIHRYRVILDVEEDVFRDIDIQADANLEDFHNAIVQAFGFEGNEMAAFYLSNDSWEQGEEFVLFSLDDEDSRAMAEVELNEVASQPHDRLIYVYDFLHFWKFLVELMDTAEPEQGVLYPHLVQSLGNVPEEAPETYFESETQADDDFDFDNLDDDDDLPDDYNDLNFGMSLN